MRNLILCASVFVCALLGSLAIMAAAPPAAQDSVPVGTIIAWAGEPEAIPVDWKLCDGSAVRRSKYQELFAAIGTAWGAPNKNKFNLPDLRGRFIRGADEGSGRDPDAAGRSASKKNGNSDGVGSIQEDSLQNHSHEQGTHQHVQKIAQAAGYRSIPSTAGPASVVKAIDQNITYTMNATAVIKGAKQYGTKSSLKKGEETRPANAAVNFIIKVR